MINNHAYSFKGADRMININSPLPHEVVKFTEIEFTENGEPRSTKFDDVYFSDCGGMEESEHVFIDGCDLRERLRNRAQSGESSTVSDYLVGETGFGTGLNLLTLMNFHKRLQEEEKHSGSGIILPHVTFLSVEKYPLSPEVMKRAHSRFPNIGKESMELVEALSSKELFTGLNTYEINPEFTLQLMIGDITDCYSSVCTDCPVDSWFLDGFNPKSNCDMWSVQSMKILAELSSRGTNIATFTVCREVRDNLREAGFTLVKRKGFGRKREMLSGFIDSPLN